MYDLRPHVGVISRRIRKAGQDDGTVATGTGSPRSPRCTAGRIRTLLRGLRSVGSGPLLIVAAATVVFAGACALGADAESATASAVARAASGGECNSPTSCYTPREIEAAYGILPLLRRGVDGRGETVVLPEIAEGLFPLPEYTDVRHDMALFDRLFALPAPQLRIDNSIAGSGRPWQADGEEVLDAEMLHAAAPRAAITIVLVKPSSFNDARGGVAAAVAALRAAVTQGASVVSISAAGQTGGEHCDTPSEVRQLNSALQNAINHHITVVAASGDVGPAGEPCHLAEGLIGGSFPPV
jgi:subtilase family serine protease